MFALLNAGKFGTKGIQNVVNSRALRYFTTSTETSFRTKVQSTSFRTASSNHVFTNNAIYNVQSRPFFTFFKKKDTLEEQANSAPTDASIQANYMRDLYSNGKFEDVTSRYESGKFANNDDSRLIYILSLVGLQKTEQAIAELGKGTSTGTGMTIEQLLNQNARGGPNFNYSSLPPSSTPMRVEIVTSRADRIWNIIRPILWLIILGGVTYYVLTSEKRGSSMPFTITNAHQEVWNVETKFADVKGVDEAKEELIEIVEYLKNPQQFTKLGARLPKGVMLVGEPGTGKTLLARALAGEAGVPFLYTSGSSFDEMFVGVGPKRVRNLFEDAKKLAPCIVFIDEIDSVGSNRKYAQFSSGARESTLNQLLTELDGFQSTQGIVVVGATNFPESIDPALLRPGRFDKQVVVPVPDIKGRKEIIDMYLKKTITASEVDSLSLARGTPGFTGADLANIVNIAAIKATVKGKKAVDNQSIEEAKDEVIMGLARKSEQDPLTRKITAYHEGGHALVALYTEGATPLHKATIIQRGRALGVTVFLPERDDPLTSRKKLMASMAVAMGGRAAEEIIFGNDEITGGASSDFQNATMIAYQMVARLGMSDKVGKISHNLNPNKNAIVPSDQERQLIDSEVKLILDRSYESARGILKNREAELHRLAAALLEYETLSADEIRTVIEGKKISRKL